MFASIAGDPLLDAGEPLNSNPGDDSWTFGGEENVDEKDGEWLIIVVGAV